MVKIKQPHVKLSFIQGINRKEDNRAHVGLRVHYDGYRKRYSTFCWLSKEEFEQIKSGAEPEERSLQQIKNRLEATHLLARQIASQQSGAFSFEQFEKEFYSQRVTSNENGKSITTFGTDVYFVFDLYIKKLYEAKRFGTATCCLNSKKALMKFRSNLYFNEITTEFLEEFEKFMLEEQKVAITTLGIYLRSLRSIYNFAIANFNIPLYLYPFGWRRHNKYQIPTTTCYNKSLTINEIRLIKNSAPSSEEIEFARDMWLFSFYCNGMNLADVFDLKFKDIKDNYLYYYRQKNKFNQRNKILIEVYIPQIARNIMGKWGNEDKNPENYVFIEFVHDCDEKRQYELIRNTVRRINKGLALLAKEVGIEKALTTIVARHSYATAMKEIGVPISEISENLGHNSVITTLTYLATFSSERRRKTSKMLSDII